MPIVAFRIGAQPFFTYSLFVAAGLLAAALSLAFEARRRGWPPAHALELLALTSAGAAAAGRLGCTLILGPDEATGQWPLLRPWGDGLLFPGALSGAALGTLLFAAWRRRPFVEAAGVLLPALALAQAAGWAGAAIHGAWAGMALPMARWAPHLRDLYGVVLPRIPLQHLAAALSLITWLGLLRACRSDLQRLAAYAVLTGWGLLGLAWFRDGRQPILGALSAEQIGYLALGLAGATLAPKALGRRAARGTPLPIGSGRS
ncbi:MAG: prolipoprotein diacylglyceryl transferase [Anaerolineae bacterium]|nr:prolipoprotein diacylglyceryl transferase [Anaerolineae bacterium]